MQPTRVTGNHTAYKQFKGRRTPADEIEELYEGLKQNDLNNFDMMLSGYIASKDAVKAVGRIGRDLRLRANMKPGSFFWCQFLQPLCCSRNAIPGKGPTNVTLHITQAWTLSWATKVASTSPRI